MLVHSYRLVLMLYAQPGYNILHKVHDPSSNVQEGSIVDQATAVREQWQ